MIFRYRFTSHEGRMRVITTTSVLTTKQRKEYMACLPGIVTYVEETVDNDQARAVRKED